MNDASQFEGDYVTVEAYAEPKADDKPKADKGKRGNPPKPAEPYELKFFADIDLNVYKEWTVEDWFGEGELLIPYGAPGSGKSVLIGDMVCHIGAGWPWFGKGVKQASVLYVAAERAQLVERRFAAFRKHHGIDDLPVTIIKGYFDMAKAAGDTDRIIATLNKLVSITRIPNVVVVIDTKRQVIGDENSDDVGKLVSNLSRIKSETDAGIIVIDHTPFHSPTKPSGRGELLAAGDVTMLIERAGGVRTARIVKANDSEDTSLAFDLESVDLGTNPNTGKVTTAPVVIVADAPDPSSKSNGYLPPSEKIAMKALEEAIIDAGEKMTSQRMPSGVVAVSLNLWREYAYKRGISDADNSEARKKAFQRAKNSLISKEKVGTWNDFVWLVAMSDSAAADLLKAKGDTGHKGDIGGTCPPDT